MKLSNLVSIGSLWMITLGLAVFGEPVRVPEGLFAVGREETVLVYVRIGADGEVSKAYPKPAVEAGTLTQNEDGLYVFVPKKEASMKSHFYATVANATIPGALDQKTIDSMQAVLFDTQEETLVRLDRNEQGDLTLDEVYQQDGDTDWTGLWLKPVPEEELQKIRAFEEALLGKWEYRGGSEHGVLAQEDKEPPPPLSIENTVKFFADGRCEIDGEQQKFYWIDGKLKRLSFQESADPADYSVLEEFDIEQLDENHLEIRSLGVPVPPSLQKESGLTPTPIVYNVYRFERVSADR